jgi:hypothetical protein
MKKALVLAMALTLILTGSLFAQGRLTQAPNATFTPGVGGAATAPISTNNDDTCDIGTAPAATLLLPYFAARADRSVNTIFTLVNVSDAPQIAHVTVWTDWSFPVLDFNVYLTGYDVQGLSMHDIIFNASIAPTATGAVGGTNAGGSTTSGTGLSPVGPLSNTVNPNFVAPIGCGSATSPLPGQINPSIATAVQNALINGTYVIPGTTASCGTNQVGSAASSASGALHPANTAVGYVTIDVASNCSLRLPTDPQYFRSDILFDNVLTGDYAIFDASPATNSAGGNPLVHIRAVPEGGPAGTALVGNQTNLPYTFYSRYINGQTAGGFTFTGATANYDRRQPLPSLFAARALQSGSLASSLRIWREGVTGPTTCTNAVSNSALPIAEIVRFDEHENFSIFNVQFGVSPATPTTVSLPETANVPASSASFPAQPTTAGDVGGWMYLNLDFGTANPAGVTSGGVSVLPNGATDRPSQNWVTVAQSGTGAAAGALAVEFDATWLGNGCTGITGVSEANANGGVVIGPAGSVSTPDTVAGQNGTLTSPDCAYTLAGCPNNLAVNTDRPADNYTSGTNVP